ncbi:MAG: lysine--tRNA ligase [Acidobacteria bacterium]|nr:lysine--tRNA ligase [Acidobacteriota bacterium]
MSDKNEPVENEQITENENDLIKIRKEKLQKIADLGFEIYPSSYEQKEAISEIAELYSGYSEEKLKEENIKIKTAGRIIGRRIMGKTTFIDIIDGLAKIQIYFQKNKLDEKHTELLGLLDIGDFIGVSGELFKTRTGELTIVVDSFKFLSKALRPLPEKFHGLQDVEARYRQRYLDLIMNQKSREVFEIRSKTIEWLRRLLNARKFLEVETPMMQPIAGGAAARPFITHHNTLDMDLYLRIAPELYLKRLEVGCMERVYEINRNFRNEGISTKHNPEFTMLEFYQAYIDYKEMMRQTEAMLVEVVEKVHGTTEISYQGKQVNFKAPWPRITFYDSIMQYTGAKKEELQSRESIIAIAKKNEVEFDPKWSDIKILNELFEKKVEPNLFNPTFIIDYPLEISPLSKKKPEDPNLVERFELFIAGMEIANGFSELNDPVDQRHRFEMQIKEREMGDDEAHQMDEDYVTAMEYGMPPIAGEGIGIDRLVMLFTDRDSIREVILFPQLRKN